MSLILKGLYERKASLIQELADLNTKVEGENRNYNEVEAKAHANIKEELRSIDLRIANAKEVAELSATGVGADKKDERAYKPQFEKAAKVDAKDVEAQREAFRNYIMTGEVRDLTTSSQGGVVAPSYFNDGYIAALKGSVSVVSLGAKDIQTPDMNPFYPPFVDDTANSAQNGAEGFTANAATDPTMANTAINAFRYTPGALTYSVEMARSNFVAFEQLLQQVALDQIARTINADCVNGNGSNKITGYLNGATVGKTTALSTTFTYSELQDCIASLDMAYRMSPSCRIVGSSAAKKVLRSMTDGSNRLIWGPNEPIAVDGIPFVEVPSLGSVATGQVPLAICDFSRYLFRSVTGVSVIVDNITAANAGKIKLFVASWHGGRLVDSNAIRTLRMSLTT